MISIGQLSKETGVKVPTIRYYEKIGLIEEPRRTEGNQRSYPPSAVKRLKFINHSRQLGFPLEDIRELLSLSDHPEQSCAEADEIACRQLNMVEERIAQLQALRDELSHMVGKCHRHCVADCTVLKALGDHTQCLHDHARISLQPLAD